MAAIGLQAASQSVRGLKAHGGKMGAVLHFLKYAAVAAVVVAVSFPSMIRPWYLSWGATTQETLQGLPGDELVPNPVEQSTRAITINAPAAAIWPWLVQIGQGRGGLYSYDWLENLVGLDIHSASRVVPELQNLKVGDTVRMVPEPFVIAGKAIEGGPKYVVASVQPNRALILRPPVVERDNPSDFRASWAFVLAPIDDHTTRLILRARSYSDPAWVAPVMGVEPIHFLMEQKMMRGIKERSEQAFVR